LAPDTVTLCPAEPLAGLSEEITGGPAGATATVVVVVVEGVVGVVAGDPPFRGCVDGGREGTVVAGPEPAAVEDDGAELPVNDTINAMVAATTRTATVTTVGSNQRSGRLGGGATSPGRAGGCGSRGGAGGRPASWGGATSTRLAVPWVRGGGGGASGGAPADARARRTALSIAPRAR
jgi:hypothetical protein